MNLNILVVEDNEINQMILTRVLEGAGHHITSAMRGEEAINFFNENDYDIILMDLNMPDIDGFEVTLKMREIEKERGDNPKTIIAAVTSSVEDNIRDKALESGFDDFLVKPVSSDLVIKTYQKHTK